MESLSFSDPSVESALTLMCAAGGEEASVEVLGYSTGLTLPQFQMVALVVFGNSAFTQCPLTSLVAPAGSPPSAPASAKSDTVIADGEGTSAGEAEAGAGGMNTGTGMGSSSSSSSGSGLGTDGPPDERTDSESGGDVS